VLLLISDGQDTSAGPARRQYRVPIGGASAVFSSENTARDTGGYVEPLRDPSHISAAVARICDELQSQYLLGFEPAHADGKVHPIAVTVKNSR
jgi:hypothetical protein